MNIFHSPTRNRTRLVVGLFLVAVGTRSACALPAAPLVVQVAQNGLAPWDSSQHGRVLITFSNAVLGRLVDFTEEQRLIPSLLEKFYWDFDAREYRMVLKPGVRFHNGRLATVDDLEFSLARFFYTTRRADPVAALRGIAGADKVAAGAKYRPWSLEGIRRIDDRSLAVRLRKPDFTFPFAFRDGWLSLVPREALTDDLVSWKDLPVGAGPYRVEKVDDEEHRSGRRTRLVWAGSAEEMRERPPLVELATDGVTRADLVLFPGDATAPAPLVEARDDHPDSYVGLFFNRENALARNAQFRQALAAAVDGKALAALEPEVRSPLNEPLPSSFGGRLGAGTSYRPSRARKFLARLGLVGKKAAPIRAAWITGLEPEEAGQRALRTALEEQFAAVGLTVRFERSNAPTFPVGATEPVFKVDVRGTSVADPLILFRAYETPALLSRYYVGDEARLSAGLRKAESQPEISTRMVALRQVLGVFVEETIVVPLFERRARFFLAADRVRSLGAQYGVGFDLARVKLW